MIFQRNVPIDEIPTNIYMYVSKLQARPILTVIINLSKGTLIRQNTTATALLHR